MGLFSKKEACPVCGGEVKGLFLVKIGGKKALCKNCSKQVSMNKSLLETATPEFIQEHLEYRRKNAEKYAGHNWTVKITGIPGFKFGLDEAGRAIYLVHDSIRSYEENPVVFDFDQLTGYEFFRGKKCLDTMADTGMIPLETGLSALAAISRIAKNDNSGQMDCFHLKLTAADPYWAEMDIKIDFDENQVHGFGGFGGDMQQVCQYIKDIIRKDELHIYKD